MPKRNAAELARDAVVVAALKFVAARPTGTRWTRDTCIAHYNAQVELDAAVAAYLQVRAP